MPEQIVLYTVACQKFWVIFCSPTEVFPLPSAISHESQKLSLEVWGPSGCWVVPIDILWFAWSLVQGETKLNRELYVIQRLSWSFWLMTWTYFLWRLKWLLFEDVKIWMNTFQMNILLFFWALELVQIELEHLELVQIQEADCRCPLLLLSHFWTSLAPSCWPTFYMFRKVTCL